MSAPDRNRILLFGLSANPPTGWGGHAGIVRWASTQADEVWVLPVYRHAFAEKRDLAPYEDRLAMAKLAFESIPNVYVKETERDVVEQTKGKIGTIDVVRKLIADHPSHQFTLLLGGDTYRDLHEGRWKESDALRALVPIRVVSRDEHEGGEKVPGLTDVSSSRVRACLDDDDYLARALQPQVLDYIRAHQLYTAP